MEEVFSQFGLGLLIAIAAVAFFAGFVKGLVGFAMPMIFIGGLTFFVSPDVAVGILIFPTLVSNFWQAIRSGWSSAIGVVAAHWRFLSLCSVILLGVTQVVPYLSTATFFAFLGTVVVLFATLMLSGWVPKGRIQGVVEWVCAVLAGMAGGIAGVWGPPTVLYLAAKRLSKSETMQTQGVIYGLGAVLLTVGHQTSGILNVSTASMGALMVLPAMAGIWVGFQVQDRFDQQTFRKAMLIVLILTGLNLLRRGLF